MSKRIDLPSRIILSGFSGTGKTAVAPIVAEQLGWQVIDTDPLIEKQQGKSILDIFRDEGEERFRELETAAIREACSQEDVVIATGGGAILSPENRRRMASGGFLVCLEARPETILSRLQRRGEAEPLDRPLLAVAEPLARIRSLKQARQYLYSLCDWGIHTDEMSAEEVAAEVLRAWREIAPRALADPSRLGAITAPEAATPPGTLHAISAGATAIVHTITRDYPVFAAWGELSRLGERLREAGLGTRAYVIADEAAFHHLGDEVEASLRKADIEFDTYLVPPGEASKTLRTASEIYDWLLGQKAERGHAVVAVGGGVATDLGGYVAATFARGLPLAHVPTSLLAMVDASIGGKVGVNLPQAKNMIGAFYQPRLVLMDVAALRTLPAREYFSGWAEVIKHGFIADESLVTYLEEQADAISKLQPEATTEAIRSSVAVKAHVVSEDEFETLGPRTMLNYGHTLAHAIESATGYGRYLHGEAVSIGMTAAAAISVRLGLLPAAIAERQARLLERYRLPLRAEGLDRERLRVAMALDKKVVGRRLRWVLLEGIGRPVIRDDVPAAAVEAALDEVLGR